MNVGAERRGGVENDDGDDVSIRRGIEEAFGGLAIGIMDGEGDRRRGMAESMGLLRCDLS